MKDFKEYQKEDIMALQGIELLEYVNYMMGNGYSFNKLCEEKGLYNKTIRARMKQVGGVYDGELKRYVIKDVKIQSKHDNNVIETEKETQNESQKESPKTPEVPGVLSVQDKDVINSLKEAILGLTSELATLNTIKPVTHHQEAKTSVKTYVEAPVIASDGFMVLNLNGEVKSRPMKLYPEVLNRLDAFCDKYPQYSKQRIISTLLMEAMDKYDR